ncbi:MAG TPA: hypothetical protein VLI54_00460 [Bacillota bacterium]|nr:hypothetical protein [Bacillota bacterium]
MPVHLPTSATGPALPTRAARRRNLRHNILKGGAAAVAVTALAIGSTLVVKGCSSDADPGKKAPKAECIDTSPQAAQRDKLVAGLAQSATKKTLKWDRATAVQTATADGLHLADTRQDASRIAADKTLSGSAKAAQVDNILNQGYNVRLRYSNNVGADTLEHTPSMLASLAPAPIELVHAAVDTIDIANGSVSSPMVDSVNGKSVGGFTPGARDGSTGRYAWIDPSAGSVDRIVFGMGLHAAACTDPAQDPRFTALNPQGFQYGQKANGDTSWKGVTTSAANAGSLESDYDGIAKALLNPTYEDCKAVAGSEVLQKKMALFADRAASLTSPGVEDYLAREFFGRCAMNIATGTTFIPDFS